MPSLTVNGAQIACDEAGSGHPLLLVHAGIVDRHMWDPVWEALSMRYRVIRPDLRGYGESAASRVPYTNWQDLAELLHSLESAPAHVVGVSNGAAASLDLALAEPDLVDRLVLVAPGLAGWDWSARLKADWVAEEAAWQRRDLDEVAWMNVRIWLDGPVRSGEADPALREKVFGMYRDALELQAGEGVVDASPLEPRSAGRLGEVRAPTLVVVGGFDQPDMMRIGERLQASIDGARLAVMQGVAHLPPMEAPNQFAGLVASFLDSAPGA